MSHREYYTRRDMLSHIVIHDEARKTGDLFLSEKMWAELLEKGSIYFQGRFVPLTSVCDFCRKIFYNDNSKKRHKKNVHQQQMEGGGMTKVEIPPSCKSSLEEKPYKGSEISQKITSHPDINRLAPTIPMVKEFVAR